MVDHSHVRYLEFQSEIELKEYLEGIIENLFEYNEYGIPNKISNDKDGGLVWNAFFSVIEEYNKRGIAPPDYLIDTNNNPLPFTKYSAHLKQAIDLKKDIPGKPLAYRFSKKQYLNRFLNEGILRITPASMYNDEALLESVKDNELTSTVLRHPSQVEITHFDKKTGKPFLVNPIGNVKIQSSFPTNYYVLCLSIKYDPRMFDAFDADACLLIYDPNRFTQLLNETMPKIKPLLGCTYPWKVSYIDHKNPYKAAQPVLSKDIKYHFQSEVRYIWLPIPFNVLSNIDPFEIKLNNINDFCKIVEL
jgi:hypothetical protein